MSRVVRLLAAAVAAGVKPLLVRVCALIPAKRC